MGEISGLGGRGRVGQVQGLQAGTSGRAPGSPRKRRARLLDRSPAREGLPVGPRTGSPRLSSLQEHPGASALRAAGLP